MESLVEKVQRELQSLKDTMWKRIDSGHFERPLQAQAMVKIFDLLVKAEGLAVKHLSQHEMQI